MIKRVFWDNVAQYWSKVGITIVPDVDVPVLQDLDDEDDDIDDILDDIFDD